MIGIAGRREGKEKKRTPSLSPPATPTSPHFLIFVAAPASLFVTRLVVFFKFFKKNLNSFYIF
jgi:hypothetical protein